MDDFERAMRDCWDDLVKGTQPQCGQQSVCGAGIASTWVRHTVRH
jgi:hypothetical protein